MFSKAVLKRSIVSQDTGRGEVLKYRAGQASPGHQPKVKRFTLHESKCFPENLVCLSLGSRRGSPILLTHMPNITDDTITINAKGVIYTISKPSQTLQEKIDALFTELNTKDNIQKVVIPLYDKQKERGDIGVHQRTRNNTPYRVLFPRFMRDGMTRQQLLDLLVANEFRIPAPLTLSRWLHEQGWTASRMGPNSEENPITYSHN